MQCGRQRRLGRSGVRPGACDLRRRRRTRWRWNRVRTNGRASVRPPSRRPLYARMLGLRYVRPSALMSFLLCECAIALAALLALAELVSWWAVAVLPLSIAAMVKLNDLVTGAIRRSA